MGEHTNPVQALLAHIASDEGIAWAWFCNIAVPIMDVVDGCTHKQANEAAAHLMQHLFNYDITKHELYGYDKSVAQQYAEFRIAADREEDEQIARESAS